jgi:hypothetical protein
MTDYIKELVAASPNFRFLAGPSMHLAGDGATAEAYVYSDPDAALARARRFGETLVKLALVRSGQTVEERQTFSRGIRALRTAGAISADLLRALVQIRDDGNEAVHGRSDDVVKAAAAVRACFELGLWWHRTVTGREASLTFTPPKPGETTTPVLLRKVERQLAGLEATLNASLAAREQGAPPAPTITIGPAAADRHRWQPGSTVECGGASYLAHRPVDAIKADDGSWTLMEADGHRRDNRAAPVRLRAVLAGDSGGAAVRMVEGLAVQTAYLRRRGRSKSLPRLLAHEADGRLHVTVTTRPAGATWHEAFGGGGQALDPLLLPLAVDALAQVADALADLHSQGAAHRALSGESILVTSPGRRGVLRDLGLAWWPPLRGEGGTYRAPEQRSVVLGPAGPATDVFQLAALLRHTCTGIGPGAGPAGQLRILLPGFPEELEVLLASAIDPDPTHRPDAIAFAAGLRRGRHLLAAEAPRGH